MKILIVNEYVKYRGAEQIVEDQIKLFNEHGNKVSCLCFNFGTCNINEVPIDYDVCKVPKLSKLLFDPITYRKIKNKIDKIDPDVIICHNIFSSPKTIYKCFKGYKTYQVIHDYKPICPTTTCIKHNNPNEICQGYKRNKCIKNCAKGVGKLKIFCQLRLIKQTEYLRKKYIDSLISPSDGLENKLLNYGYNACCVNNPIDVKQELTRHIYQEKKKIIFVGAVNAGKGIVQFLNAIKDVREDYIFHLYGKISEEVKEEIETIVEESNSKIAYKGCINHNELLKKYGDYDFMVVPSFGMDNYPTTVLEAMAYGVVVLSSDRGGMVEMLDDKRGIVYRYDEGNIDLVKKFRAILNLDERDYISIRENAYAYVVNNNNYETYYNRINNVIGRKDES